MERYDIYRDIAARCDGTVFIGVVGPVRTGKSTLIAQMMQQLVLPNLPQSHKKSAWWMICRSRARAGPL